MSSCETLTSEQAYNRHHLITDFEQAVNKFVRYVNANVDCKEVRERIVSLVDNASNIGMTACTVGAWLAPDHPLHQGNVELVLNLVCTRYKFEPSQEVRAKLLKWLRYLQLLSSEIVSDVASKIKSGEIKVE